MPTIIPTKKSRFRTLGRTSETALSMPKSIVVNVIIIYHFSKKWSNEIILLIPIKNISGLFYTAFLLIEDLLAAILSNSSYIIV